MRTFDREALLKLVGKRGVTVEAKYQGLVGDTETSEAISRLAFQVQQMAITSTLETTFESIRKLNRVRKTLAEAEALVSAIAPLMKLQRQMSDFSRIQSAAAESVVYLKAKEVKERGAKFNFSAQDLELYSKDPKSAKAAKAISKALEQAGAQIMKDIQDVPYSSDKVIGKMLDAVYAKYVNPVLTAYREQGATDSEPSYHTKQALIDLVKGHYGIMGMTNLSDYF